MTFKAANVSQGFAWVAEPTARVLVLGTLPGQVSLQRQQYYAQPQNAFWKIMGVLFGTAPEMPYEVRLQALKDHGIALWDVCAAAHRPGSLDASIARETVSPNSFEEFFGAHPQIQLVCFNGAKAEVLYRRHVRPRLIDGPDLTYVTLPSTSAANAGTPFADKLARWSVIGSPDLWQKGDV